MSGYPTKATLSFAARSVFKDSWRTLSIFHQDPVLVKMSRHSALGTFTCNGNTFAQHTVSIDAHLQHVESSSGACAIAYYYRLAPVTNRRCCLRPGLDYHLEWYEVRVSRYSCEQKIRYRIYELSNNLPGLWFIVGEYASSTALARSITDLSRSPFCLDIESIRAHSTPVVNNAQEG